MEMTTMSTFVNVLGEVERVGKQIESSRLPGRTADTSGKSHAPKHGSTRFEGLRTPSSFPPESLTG